MILYKTELALAELKSEKRTLSIQERRVLLFVNETRNITEIRALVNFANASEVIYLLEKKGYLTKIAPAADRKPTKEPQTGGMISAVSGLIGQISTFKLPELPARQPKQSPAEPSKQSAAGPVRTEALQPNAEIPTLTQARTTPDAPPIDEAAILKTKALLLETSELHLGLFSLDLIDQIKRARSPDALRICISRWHMAMQESKSGRLHCMQYLQQVNDLCEPAADALKQAG